MSEKNFNLEILTPGERIFRGDVTRLVAPSTEGYFEILYNHTPFLAALKMGHVKVTFAGGTKLFAIGGGFIEVYHNRVSLLAESAESAEKIDVQRAEAARERAKRRIRERKEDTDLARARAALFRAANRLKIAEMMRT